MKAQGVFRICGENVMITSRNIQDNSIVGGIPVRVLGIFDDFLEKRRIVSSVYSVDNMRQYVSLECEDEMWNKFCENRK